MALTKTPIELSSTPGIVDNSNATAITIDSSEKVGIGTGSPDFSLSVGNDSDSSNYVSVRASNTGSSGYLFSDAQDADVGYVNYSHATNHMGFGANGAERMRIGSTGIIYVNGDGTGGRISGDGSGGLVLQDGNGRQSFKIMSPSSGSSQAMTLDANSNLLVGKSASNSGTVGVEARATGRLFVTADGAYAAKFERLSSDGTLIQLTKDGATVGSWRSRSGLVSSLVLDPRSTNSGCGIGTTDGLAIVSTDNTGALVDSDKDLGQSGVRWRDLYLSGGVYLGGTGAANKLDSYEEGSGSVVVTGSSGGTATTSGNYQYTKIGNIVSFQFEFSCGSISGVTGTLRVALPFTSTNYSAGAVRTYNVTFNGSPYLGASNNTAYLDIMTSKTGVATGDILSTGYYFGELTYRTA